ncbi:ZIP family metal transporter [Zestomonas carbonaria]|uniref:Zinc transporter ZupT n=1 Tax=Zestomonas carbonaria TaxID=2762745 RepID=A0A7U7I9D1_9GAMM|nr:ZIP family metal transporter [Pseudomonas carbonaria]CAD5106782.1 Zinc transporter ZupT [Pseudomonas carbonaria]
MLAFDSPPIRLLRQAIGLLVLAFGAVLLFERIVEFHAQSADPVIWQALQGGLLCALGTALGALPVLFIRSVTQRTEAMMLGFGGGVMLAATMFSLLLPGLESARGQGYAPWQASLLVAGGLMLGAGVLFACGRWLPVQSPGCVSPNDERMARVLLFVVAIVLHNVPEGMAVGVATGASLSGSERLALGIALQDVPEGMIVALVLLSAGMGRFKAVAIGAASGLVEPLFAVICAWMVGVSTVLLPWGLAFAAGAMLFAVIHEIIPQSQRNAHAMVASLGLLAGFCLMMGLDTGLG